MKVYLLEGEEYNPETKNGWQLIDMTVEEAIKQYSGKKTIMIKWENDGIEYMQILPAMHETSKYLGKIYNGVAKKILTALSNLNF